LTWTRGRRGERKKEGLTVELSNLSERGKKRGEGVRPADSEKRKMACTYWRKKKIKEEEDLTITVCRGRGRGAFL